jgi:hypothetical protein
LSVSDEQVFVLATKQTTHELYEVDQSVTLRRALCESQFEVAHCFDNVIDAGMVEIGYGATKKAFDAHVLGEYDSNKPDYGKVTRKPWTRTMLNQVAAM